MKKIIYSVFAIILLLGSILIFNTLRFNSIKSNSESESISINEAFEKEIALFQGGLKIPTVSGQDKALEDFIQYLKKSYPSMAFEKVNKYSLVFKWQGKNPNLKPIIFLSHYDVVPAGEKELWKNDAFSGEIIENRIYGRGAIDMKSMLFALMSARQNLESEKFTPERDIYFAFGHDEETGGTLGAEKVVEYFQNKNIQFEAVFDEGGVVTNPGIAGMTSDLALIGLAEKGYISAYIKVKGNGGHSAMPPAVTALGQAGKLMQKFESHQFPARIIEPIQGFLTVLASDSGFMTKMAVSNQWLFKSVLLNKFSGTPPSNALVRTTTALTMSKGSDAENVLPNYAEIVVNFRILPGDTIQDVKKHVEKITSGFDVEITYKGEKEASKISPKDSFGFKTLEKNISKFFPEAKVTSYVTIGGTDSRKYEKLSSSIYRFLPVKLTKEERATVHNANESISVDDYRKMIGFFKEMFKAF